MACNPYRYKTFLVSTNIGLLFVGMAVFILGINMQQLLSSLPFIAISPIAGAIKAVIAAGFFILVTGVTGVGFACIESLWFFFLYFGAMGFIVIMEFAAGATLLIVRNTVQNYVTRLECSNECPATLDNLVLNYSLPVAGLLVGIILVEVVMMYIAMKMWMLARELSKTTETPSTDVAQNVQMRSVGSRSWLPSFGVSPIPGPSPRGNHLHNRTHTPLACYGDFDGFSKPPQYETLPPDMQLPPTYMEIAPGALANRTPTSEQIYYSV